MIQGPQFSVIVPTRGDRVHLRQALASALDTERDVEVLVVHDRREGEPPLPAEIASDASEVTMPPDDGRSAGSVEQHRAAISRTFARASVSAEVGDNSVNTSSSMVPNIRTSSAAA